jgi:hypothetical protein
MVIHPANTGRETNNRNEVKTIETGYSGANKPLPYTDIQQALNEVEIKLIDPINEDKPTICNEKNIISTELHKLTTDNGT